MLVLSLGKSPEAKSLSAVENFLSEHEKVCVSLLDRIARREVEIYCILGGRHEIRGVFSYSLGGQFLHCIPDALEHYDEYLVVLRIYFSNMNLDKLFSVIGEEIGTNLILSSLYLATRRMPESNSTFSLMEYSPRREASGSGLKFDSCPGSVCAAVCPMQLLDSLIPIQEAYEKEEVLTLEQSYNPLTSRFVLKRNIAEQRLYVTLFDGRIVSKAALNAVGRNCVQLGGVFTLPEFRSRGFAEFLIKKIVAEKRPLGKSVVLFVRPKNSAATRLYRRCGFVPFAKFKISYY